MKKTFLFLFVFFISVSACKPSPDQKAGAVLDNRLLSQEGRTLVKFIFADNAGEDTAILTFNSEAITMVRCQTNSEPSNNKVFISNQGPNYLFSRNTPPQNVPISCWEMLGDNEEDLTRIVNGMLLYAELVTDHQSRLEWKQ